MSYRISVNHIGITSFQDEHTYTNVLYYLLSCLLKSNKTTSKDMVEKTGFTIKKCQRYIYNSFNIKPSNVNLEDISIILKYIDYSYSNLFKYIEIFITNKYDIAVFKNNIFEFYFNSYYSQFDKIELERLLKLRKNIVAEYNSPELKDEIETELAAYPSHLIIQTKQTLTY